MTSSASGWVLQFGVDDFERVGTSPWEGVRNHEAKNLMMEMKVRDRVSLFFRGGCLGTDGLRVIG